jgi:hypothetical protein
MYGEVACATSGTAVAEMNADRANPNISSCSWYRSPGIITSGTRLSINYIGSTGKADARGAGSMARDSEFILKSEKKYIVKVTANTNNVNAALNATYYMGSGSKRVI